MGTTPKPFQAPVLDSTDGMSAEQIKQEAAQPKPNSLSAQQITAEASAAPYTAPVAPMLMPDNPLAAMGPRPDAPKNDQERAQQNAKSDAWKKQDAAAETKIWESGLFFKIVKSGLNSFESLGDPRS